MLDAGTNFLVFESMDRLFDTRTVSRSGPVWQLPRTDHPLDFKYTFAGATHDAEDILVRNRTNALLVMKHGRIVYERYCNGTGDSTHFISFSMAKSITSMLVGAALRDGYVRSLDDRLDGYIPELRGTDYGAVTIRQVMRMRSGVNYDERYDFGVESQAQWVFEHAIVRNEVRFADLSRTLKRRAGDKGAFNYSTMDTAVLGWLLESATRQPLSTYMTAKLWEPLGMEAPGFWIADGPPGIGRALNGMGFNATLRDYARLGQMMLQRGSVEGRQVIPSEWVATSTESSAIEDSHGELPPDVGYAYQWWTLHGTGAFFALGLQGQFIFVDPKSETVVVKLSYWTPGDDREAMAEALAFLKAASAWEPH